MSNVTTVSGNNFPNTDVTHRPRRMQSQVANEVEENINGDTVNVTLSEIPQSVTIESAIKYFTDHADGAKAMLYNRTATWLKELLQTQQKLKKANNTVAVETGEPVSQSGT